MKRTPAPSSRPEAPDPGPVRKRQAAAPLAIGQRIRFRRLQLGLTLRQIGERSGLSAPFLSQAERNLTVPSLVSILALAKALDVEVSYFLEVPTERSIVCRAANRPRIVLDSPVAYYDVSSNLAHRQMDAIVMAIPPGHTYPIDQRDGEEFMIVLQGELEVEIGDIRTTLGPGDSAHFTSQLAHASSNRSGETVTVLYVGTPAIFADAVRTA